MNGSPVWHWGPGSGSRADGGDGSVPLLCPAPGRDPAGHAARPGGLRHPTGAGRTVRELQEMVHRQSQLLQSSQEALAASQERCQELQERSESECWVLASELGQRIAALEAGNRNLRCERDQLESRTRGLREEPERSRSSMLHVGQKLKEQGGRAGPAWPASGTTARGCGSTLASAAPSAWPHSWPSCLRGSCGGGRTGPPQRPSSSWCWCGWGCSCRIWPFASSSPRPLPPATGSAGPSSWRPGWPRCRCGAARVERFELQRASRVRGVPRVVLDCAQLRSEGRGRQLYALQDCALAAPSGFLLQCRPAGRGGGGRAGAAPLPAGRPRGPQRPAGGGLPAAAQPGQPG
nr:uncharacterized protein LOC125628457 [Caretta caretta]